ncbi:HK97-gp10 family putative phage morphogenesis protein [Lysinibacillus sp. KU-BSD001]|uniref:HK97-gp10 family putative phage morphogenesis protein n=1 Tax=Lysinibacillus sp. KU-BSD001 TaxID=3141328 RepID=UPI0036E7721C
MEVQFTGLQEILQSLGNLALEEEEENKALNAGAKVVKKAVIEEAPIDANNPVDSGTLKENIQNSRAKDGVATIHSGGAYHAHLVENGRSGGSGIFTKNGKRQKITWGPTAPNPFFTRGFEKSKDEATQAMIDEIKKAKNL